MKKTGIKISGRVKRARYISDMVKEKYCFCFTGVVSTNVEEHKESVAGVTGNRFTSSQLYFFKISFTNNPS